MTSEREVSHAEAQQALPRRSAVRLTLDRQFGSLFWGKLLSNAGAWGYGIVAAVVVYAATGSSLWVGLVSVAQFGPQLVLTPLAGRWADRGHAGRQIVLGRVLCTLGALGGAVFCFIQGAPDGTQDAAVIIMASFVTGVGFVIGGPAQQAIIPLLIRPGELPTAMALNSIPMTFARVAGPAGGALVAANYSAAMAFLLAALSHFIFIILVLLASLPAGIDRDGDEDVRVLTALRYVRADRTMLLLLAAVFAVGFASEPSITLTPPLAAELGGGTELVGRLTAAFGVGAATGYFAFSLASRYLRQPHLLQGGLAVLAVGTALLAWAPGEWTAATSLAIAGVGFMAANTAAATLIQERVPAELRGRIMALWMVGFVGSRPLAAALEGYLADAVSLTVAILVTAVIPVAALAGFRVKRLDFTATVRTGV